MLAKIKGILRGLAKAFGRLMIAAVCLTIIGSVCFGLFAYCSRSPNALKAREWIEGKKTMLSESGQQLGGELRQIGQRAEVSVSGDETTSAVAERLTTLGHTIRDAGDHITPERREQMKDLATQSGKAIGSLVDGVHVSDEIRGVLDDIESALSALPNLDEETTTTPDVK